MRLLLDVIVLILGVCAGLFLMIIFVEVVEPFQKIEEDEIEKKEKEGRYEKVSQLMSEQQVINYVEKHRDKIGYRKKIDEIDKLISNDSEEYKLEEGEVTGNSIQVDRKFKKYKGKDYIEVTILNRKVFTEYYKQFIYTRVRHRTVDYDIGTIYILLDVDKNEYGYKLLDKQLFFSEEDIKNVNG